MSEDVLNTAPLRPMTAIQIRDLVASSKTRIRQHSTNNQPEDEAGVSIAEVQLGADTSSGDDSFDPLDDCYYGWDGSYSHPPKNKVVFDLNMVQSINKFLPRVHVPTWISRPIKQLGDQDQLVYRLNAIHANDKDWRSSSEWCKMSTEERKKYSPVSSQAEFKNGIEHNGMNYQTYNKNSNNSVIHVISRSNGATLFGKIMNIFTHQRSPEDGQVPVSDTWLLVQYYTPVPEAMPNPFTRLGEPDLEAHLRLETTSKPYLTHIDEVIAHCAWIVFEKGEVHYLLDKKSIALISLSR
ncbi:hypothetical protein DFH28DRAFT_916677 [Melampsora americana]|nr:hypothetical protein DFH28DRAFT_916677 [Melampsora americana]